LRLAL